MNIGVFVGRPARPTGFRWVEPVTNIYVVPDDQVKNYLTEMPVIITDIYGRGHSADMADLVIFDTEDSVACLGGHLYKMPNGTYRHYDDVMGRRAIA